MSDLFVNIFSPSQGYLGAQHLLKAKREEEIIRESNRERDRNRKRDIDRKIDRVGDSK